jgi:23S rRNA (pseudouridine1915-N3)-methyltransferase
LLIDFEWFAHISFDYSLSTKYEIAEIERPVFQKRHSSSHCCSSTKQTVAGVCCDMLLAMQVTLAHIGARASARDSFDALTQFYLERCSAFAQCSMEAFTSEQALLAKMAKRQGRTVPVVVLLDSRGRSMTSEAFAAWLGSRRDEGTQHVLFAIGPADGWSDGARKQSALVLSLGPMTMAHALARLAMAEQLYRALTILAGHPYHSGH